MSSTRFMMTAIVVGALGTSQALAAANWCSSNHAGVLFCDDFDRYCSPQPPPGEACTGSPDTGLMRTLWIPTGPCSSEIALDGTHAVSPPWGARTNTQENSTLALTRRSLGTAIRDKFGESYSSVVATDLNPLVLEFTLKANRPRFDNTYLSLGSGSAVAHTDYAWSNFCGCTSPDPRYPVICAQEPTPANCPPLSGAPHVPTIAVGLVAYLDADPCHCGTATPSPANDHLSFYDGYKWYRLRAGLFSGSGDFLIRGSPHHNAIRVTIRPTTLKVELTIPSLGEYSWCELPRDYMGAFNSITVGYAVPCQLKLGAWECRGDPDDPTCGVGAPNGSVPFYDNVVLRGGVAAEAPGACCFANTSCTETIGGDCVTLGGTPAGAGTTCAMTPCCPPLKPDHDLDQDIDQADFGWFQQCLSAGSLLPPPTVPCWCGDLDGDGDVDQGDFARFFNCMRGPGILADPDCAD